jgi:hypothetical protein
MGRQAERLARKENRSLSELMREAFRRYQQAADEDAALQRRQLEALEAAAGAWKDQDHPELRRGAADWVRKLRRDYDSRLAKAIR